MAASSFHRYLAILSIFTCCANGQSFVRPSITAGGIVNAASFTAPVAPGALISIFGARLSSSTASATNLPLPTQLGGAEVRIGGRLAPLVFVSAGQINAQVPYETTVGTVTVEVSVTGIVSSGQAQVQVVAGRIGLFTASNPTRLIAIARGDLVGPGRPAVPGEIIVLYGTGSGVHSPPIANGVGAPGAPLALPVLPVTAKVNGQAARIVYAGATANFVGLLQINLELPGNLPTGNATIEVSSGGVAGPTGEIPIVRPDDAGAGRPQPSTDCRLQAMPIQAYTTSVGIYGPAESGTDFVTTQNTPGTVNYVSSYPAQAGVLAAASANLFLAGGQVPLYGPHDRVSGGGINVTLPPGVWRAAFRDKSAQAGSNAQGIKFTSRPTFIGCTVSRPATVVSRRVAVGQGVAERFSIQQGESMFIWGVNNHQFSIWVIPGGQVDNAVGGKAFTYLPGLSCSWPCGGFPSFQQLKLPPGDYAIYYRHVDDYPGQFTLYMEWYR